MFFKDPSKKYVILDIEGNAAPKIEERKILQFSALVINDNNIDEINLYNRNVKMINSYVSKLTRIDIKKCKDEGMAERRLVNTIHELLQDTERIYAYGLQFDKSILNYMFAKYKLTPIEVKWHDVIKDVPKHFNVSKTKLEIASKEIGFKVTGFHDALVDCKAIYFIMNEINKKELEKND